MIKRKLKKCLRCGHEMPIFSSGLCINCWKALNAKPINKAPIKSIKKPITQYDEVLTQKKAFLLAYNHWEGRLFLTGHKISLQDTTASNFAHVLRKGGNEWFRYFPMNIVLLTPDQHTLFDNMTEDGLDERRHNFPYEDWDKLFDYVEQMKIAYEQWTTSHYKEYKTR